MRHPHHSGCRRIVCTRQAATERHVAAVKLTAGMAEKFELHEP